MSNKINTEGVLLFEQPFAKVPFENYRKIYRTVQRNVDKEVADVVSESSNLESQSKSDAFRTDEALKSIQGIIGKVESLKRKLSDIRENAGTPTQAVMRERFQNLAKLESLQLSTEPQFDTWSDTRLDRWLVDWALRSGREETARQIAKSKNIEKLVDIDLFTDIHRIEAALASHSCAEALAWCNENKSSLKKIKSTLEFDLRLQEFIELARERKNAEAIAYSKKYLIAWHDTHLTQIKHATALLAFPPTTSCGPYRRLYDLKRWDTLVHTYRHAVYTLNTLPSEPLMHLAVYAGLASLKLPACLDQRTKNVDCPVCDGGGSTLLLGDGDAFMDEIMSTEDSSGDAMHSGLGVLAGMGLGKLAAEVPFSHHANSTIVCRLTGKIMDEDNPPMAFPNGSVYSREALEEMAAMHDGIVTCPLTKHSCEFSKLKKIYIP
ncbi:hypothetical protein FISHEDRAFT_66124 [Fistulina hepatica ATCC 64428]|uniref:Macrophage erythroblast attacher n=1 Tax=Fistulina hepatica ATCC 64428 TaxID=1128425 RepID=A0A0D7ABW6_9AGAR|nr:hypothetical protein FISHEDRAFT_66124 [Fistulina hepatica ATCC 64428]